MKHARDPALDNIEPLLEQLRLIPVLQERSRGVFYCRSRACVHFHEDPTGVFADVRVAVHWQRVAVNTDAERDALVEMLESILLNALPRERR